MSVWCHGTEVRQYWPGGSYRTYSCTQPFTSTLSPSTTTCGCAKLKPSGVRLPPPSRLGPHPPRLQLYTPHRHARIPCTCRVACAFVSMCAICRQAGPQGCMKGSESCILGRFSHKLHVAAHMRNTAAMTFDGLERGLNWAASLRAEALGGRVVTPTRATARGQSRCPLRSQAPGLGQR